jgi:hypothetical protein
MKRWRRFLLPIGLITLIYVAYRLVIWLGVAFSVSL